MIDLRTTGGSLFLALACFTGAGAQATDSARAVLIDRAGEESGVVVLRQSPAKGVILDVRLNGVPEGPHAIHIHETGTCSPPSFSSAGGHYAPRERSHGLLHADGPHGGDMLNLHVPASGDLRAERLAPHVSLDPDASATLFDADGSAVVVHAGADDYRSQPSGDAGDRLLCGVIRR